MTRAGGWPCQVSATERVVHCDSCAMARGWVEEIGALRSRLKAIREVAIEAVNEHESEALRLEMIVKLCDRDTHQAARNG